jgi:hypothetical protein
VPFDGRALATAQQNGVIRIVKGDVLPAANSGALNVDSTSRARCLGIVPES